MISAFGSLYPGSPFGLMKLAATVSTPTLPKNISSIMISLPAEESKGVAFRDEPTVPKAEKHSKATALNDNSGSTMLVRSIPMASITMETTMVAWALWTELRVSSR